MSLVLLIANVTGPTLASATAISKDSVLGDKPLRRRESLTGGPEGIRHCIAGVIAGIRFPAAYNSHVQSNVRYPFRFRPI